MNPLVPLTGLGMGLVLGVFGAGGSIVAVPVFVYLLGYGVKEAVAMSLVVVGLTATVGATGAWRAGQVEFRAALRFGVVAMVGAYGGARLAAHVTDAAQMTVFASVVLAAAVLMLRGETRSVRSGAAAASCAVPASSPRVTSALAALGVGGITGLVGVGGGFLVVPALVLLARLPMRVAVGTSLVVIAMNCAAGLIGYLGRVELAWMSLALVTGAAVFGVLVGGRLQRVIPQTALRRAFAVFLLLVGGLVLYQNRMSPVENAPAARAAGPVGTDSEPGEDVMLLRQLVDETLAQYAYLIGCQETGEAVVIDPERDVDRYIAAAEREGLRITAVAETHIHADFLSGARELAERLDARLYLSAEGGPDWQVEWAKGARLAGGAYRTTFLRDGDAFRVGNIELRAVHTPGHTPEHLSYLVTDHGGGARDPIGIATGDFVFVGDLGRPDLLEQAAGLKGVQEGAARELYRSLARFTALDDHLQVWPGHGAGSACGKALGAVPTTTVGYEKRHNASLDAAGLGEGAFVDAILADQPEPPTYFARMKRLNRAGPAVLAGLPHPRRLATQEIAAAVADPATVVVDARLDRSAFMARHLPGSLYAPFDRSFNTVVGALIEDAERPVVLVIDEAHVEGAVRDLVRIGHDRIVGFIEPHTLVRHWARGGAHASIPVIDMEALPRRHAETGNVVVDVRTAAEYRAGHVPGAVNAPHARLPLLGDRIPSEGTLLVHCQGGARSAVAAAFLAVSGRDVEFVEGEWSRLIGSGITLEHGDTPTAGRIGAGAR